MTLFHGYKSQNKRLIMKYWNFCCSVFITLVVGSRSFFKSFNKIIYPSRFTRFDLKPIGGLIQIKPSSKQSYYLTTLRNKGKISFVRKWLQPTILAKFVEERLKWEGIVIDH